MRFKSDSLHENFVQEEFEKLWKTIDEDCDKLRETNMIIGELFLLRFFVRDEIFNILIWFELWGLAKDSGYFGETVYNH